MAGTEQEPTSQERGPRFDLLLLALALVVAFVDLGGRSLHDNDVPRTGALAREMIATGEWLVPLHAEELYANKPPLYIWLVAGVSQIAGGVTPFTARLPAALALVLLVMAGAWWARVRTGSAGAGRATGLLLLSTFFLMFLGREGRLDMLAAALAVAGTALLDAQAHGKAPRHATWGAGLFFGFGLLTKGPLVLLLPAAVLVLGGAATTRWRERLARARLLPVLGIAGGIALCWFVPALLYAGQDYARALLLDQATTRIAGAGNHLQPVWFYAVELTVAGMPWGLLYLVAMLASWWPRTARALGPAVGLARAALVLVVLFSLVPTKHIRYLAPVAPLPAIVLGWWLWTRLAEQTKDRRIACTIACFLMPPIAVALVVVCARSEVGGWIAIVPAIGLVLVGAWSLRHRTVRRTFVTAGLLTAVCAILAVSILRYRFRTPTRVRFNRALATTLADSGARAYTLRPVLPEDLFLGAPNATPIGSRTALPEGAFIVCTEASLASLKATFGGSIRVVIGAMRPGGNVAVALEK